MPKQPPALKPQLGTGVGQVPAPSSLASGVNLETVVNIQNHWREYYNPLRALNLQRAIALYDFSRRGLNAELQNVYREMEGLYPTLMALIERRTAPLMEMEFNFKPFPKDRWPKGASQSMVDDQVSALQDGYSAIDNLYEAIEWQELGAFRGYAHLEKIYANPGTEDLTINHLEPVEQWHWTRKSMYSEWEYVPAATQTNIGLPIDYSQWIIGEVKRPLDRIALIQWIRASLAEKDWDSFIEIYGIPSWIVTMPPNVPKEKEGEYLTAARIIAGGGRGALPNGATATAADSPRGTNPFRPRLDWIQEQIVLAGTGGLLTMLSMPTGIGQGATGAHDDAFKQISKKNARRISALFNKQLSVPLLQQRFPGQPILASFELASNEETDVGAFIDGVSKLSAAGFMVNADQITEKTGYEVEIKPQPLPPEPVNTNDEHPGDDEAQDQIITNRTITSPDLIKSGAKQLAAAVQFDFKPIYDRLLGIYELKTPVLINRALIKLKADLNDPKSGLITAVLQNPASANALADSITAGLFNGMAGAQPIHNRKILNIGGPGSGNFGHAGRPGEIGGSGPGGGIDSHEERRKGEAAIEHILTTKQDVPNAMRHPQLGNIDFRHGDATKGIRHIITRRDAQLAKFGTGPTGEEMARRIPGVIAHGNVHLEKDSAIIEHEGHKVVLTKKRKNKPGNHWVLSAYDVDAKKGGSR